MTTCSPGKAPARPVAELRLTMPQLSIWAYAKRATAVRVIYPCNVRAKRSLKVRGLTDIVSFQPVS
jgi:hypothetical protein